MPQHASRARTGSPSRGFLAAWDALVGRWTATIPRRRGRKPEIAPDDLLAGLTYHALQPGGTLSQHFTQLFARPLADSSWSDRRTRLPWAVFTDRKSTRLNSSHGYISYAVFCLKKKKNYTAIQNLLT